RGGRRADVLPDGRAARRRRSPAATVCGPAFRNSGAVERSPAIAAGPPVPDAPPASGVRGKCHARKGGWTWGPRLVCHRHGADCRSFQAAWGGRLFSVMEWAYMPAEALEVPWTRNRLIS